MFFYASICQGERSETAGEKRRDIFFPSSPSPGAPNRENDGARVRGDRVRASDAPECRGQKRKKKKTGSPGKHEPTLHGTVARAAAAPRACTQRTASALGPREAKKKRKTP
jgi:hypothetical protein